MRSHEPRRLRRRVWRMPLLVFAGSLSPRTLHVWNHHSRSRCVNESRLTFGVKVTGRFSVLCALLARKTGRPLNNKR
jgi:hypothetical protein